MVHLASVSLAALLITAPWASSALAAPADPPVHECDRLAAIPYDMHAVAPAVQDIELSAEEAVQACEAALSDFPGVPRFQTQLGRALFVAGRAGEAVERFRKAAEQGHAAAQSWLGYMYHAGQAVPQDRTEAERWFRKAAEQDYALAQNFLGNMYANGEGVPQDYTEAAKWFRKAAEQGEAASQSWLAAMYAKGLGVPQNWAEAAKWFRKAAEQGDAWAQFELGRAHETGHGIPVDYDEAAKWFRKAAEQGNDDARAALERVTDDNAEIRMTSRRKFNEFLAKTGRKTDIAVDELMANPFVYEGETVGLWSKFITMLSNDRALFGKKDDVENMLLVSGVPAQKFTQGNSSVLLAGRVLGKEYVKLPFWGDVLLPHLEYVDVHICQQPRCAEISAWALDTDR